MNIKIACFLVFLLIYSFASVNVFLCEFVYCISGVCLSALTLYLYCKLDVNEPSETLTRDRWTEEEIRGC